MSEQITVRTLVNGAPVELTIPARITLAELLRDELDMTGTKTSCEMQVCGACTVLVDDLPVSSCTTLAAEADGRSIRTIEGLARGNDLHPVQQAFIDEFALQCGFCTPGFIMMAVALLETSSHPSREEVVEYLEGNICRCTGYRPIIDAVLRAAEARAAST
jgi:aerobic-type carbon monoxide dehydrogenase small subunit (CoxS/CutS family)